MDVDTITTLISSLGFPIVVCVALGWYIVYRDKQTNAEMESLKETIENNTLVIQKLTDKIDCINSNNTDDEGA